MSLPVDGKVRKRTGIDQGSLWWARRDDGGWSGALHIYPREQGRAASITNVASRIPVAKHTHVYVGEDATVVARYTTYIQI
jgi:hypothetical protein